MQVNSFRSTRKLLDSLKNYQEVSAMLDAPAGVRRGQSPAAACLDGVSFVAKTPVAFVVKTIRSGKPQVGTVDQVVYLKRLDWSSLGTIGRFFARIGALFGMQPPRKYRLNADESRDFRMARFHPASGNALEKAMENLTWAGSPEDLREIAKRLQDFVAARLQRIEQQLEPLASQDISIQLKARRALQRDLTNELRERLRGFEAAQIAAVLDQLGLLPAQPVAPQSILSANTADPRVRLAADRLVSLPYHFDRIPAPDLKLLDKQEIALGDGHGNGLLVLHTLVRAGFLRIADADAWKRVTAQLDSLEGDQPDNDLEAFRGQLALALEPMPGAAGRKLTLLGDILGDRMHSDLFMLCILQRMSKAGLDFDCILGNHDADFLNLYLKNRELKPDALYEGPVGGALRLGPSQEATRSLCRTVDLLNKEPSRRPRFTELVENVWMPRLKVCALSRDKQVFYAHAVANGAVMRKLEEQSGAGHAGSFARRVDHINRWFRQQLMDDKDSFQRAYHNEGGQQTALNAICWNVGLDKQSADGLKHPFHADPSLPDPSVKYQVHGHCSAVAVRLDQLRADASVDALQELRNMLRRLLTSRNTVPKLLREQLGSLDSRTPEGVIVQLGRIVGHYMRKNRAMDGLSQLADRSGTPEDFKAEIAKQWQQITGVAASFIGKLGRQEAAFLATLVDCCLNKNEPAEADALERSIREDLDRRIKAAETQDAELHQTIRHYTPSQKVRPLRAYYMKLASHFHSLDSVEGSRPETRAPLRRLHVM